MKCFNYYLLLVFFILFMGCHWSEPEIQPSYVKESAVFKFYNNGDSTLERMTLTFRLHYPVENYWFEGFESHEKNIIFNPRIMQSQLHPYDSIIHSHSEAYIGCPRYAEFAVYYSDSTSADGYRLRGKYVIDDVIPQKYAVKEQKYPDAIITVNWPKDSLLFKL